jgi:4-amino-4-deoxy-L-arabinose transferase-like glycosyltransferase
VVPLNVIGSRYFKEDIPLMFFLNLAVLMMVLTLRSSHRWTYLPAGIAVGLALSVKYVAAILIPFYILCHGVRVWRSSSGSKMKTAFEPYFFLGMVAVPAVFLLLNPYVIIEWKDFISTFHAQQGYAVTGHHDGTVILGRDYWWSFYLLRAVVPGLSLPVTLAALTGILLALWKRNAEAAFVAVWLGTFYLMMESSPAKPFPFFARYIHGLARPCACSPPMPSTDCMRPQPVTDG